MLLVRCCVEAFAKTTLISHPSCIRTLGALVLDLISKYHIRLYEGVVAVGKDELFLALKKLIILSFVTI